MASATYELPALTLALLTPADRLRAKSFTGYSMEWLPILAGAANTQAQFTISSDVDFIGLFITGTATDTASPPNIQSNYMAMLQLKAADRQLFDKPVQWNVVAGSAFSPFILPFPLWLPRATTLTGFLSSLSSINTNVRLAMFGFLLHTYNKTTSRGF